MFVPANTRLPGDEEVLTLSQFHRASDLCADAFGEGPNEAMQLMGAYGPRWRIRVVGNTTQCSGTTSGEAFHNETLNFGKWLDIVIHFKFDYVLAHNPFVEVWHDGVKISGMPYYGANCWWDVIPPYWKIGIYANYNDTMVVYYDEIRIGNATSDYASVAPGNSSTQPPSAPRGLMAK